MSKNNNKKKNAPPANERVKPIIPATGKDGAQTDDGAEKTARNIVPIAIVTLLAIVVLLLGLCVSLALTAPGSSADEAAMQSEPAMDHEHAWTPVYKTVHHDAVTGEVLHPAEYDYVTAYHTICTECGSQIDNQVQAHKEETGHIGHNTNVPVTEKRLMQDEWLETVVLEEAWTEEVLDHSVCKGCGDALYGVDAPAAEPVPDTDQAA